MTSRLLWIFLPFLSQPGQEQNILWEKCKQWEPSKMVLFIVTAQCPDPSESQFPHTHTGAPPHPVGPGVSRTLWPAPRYSEVGKISRESAVCIRGASGVFALSCCELTSRPQITEKVSWKLFLQGSARVLFKEAIGPYFQCTELPGLLNHRYDHLSK